MAYLDHAATTPMLAEALDAYVAAAREVGNPSSLHAAGRYARRLVEESRERIAAVLGARPSEVIFTSGGTESDRIALMVGLLRAFGVDAIERPDGFTVEGKPRGRLKAARIDSGGDHRIAMTAAVLGLLADEETIMYAAVH